MEKYPCGMGFIQNGSRWRIENKRVNIWKDGRFSTPKTHKLKKYKEICAMVISIPILSTSKFLQTLRTKCEQLKDVELQHLSITFDNEHDSYEL